MKITLIGYMGSGKTVIGKFLSKKLNINFIDLDSIIVEAEKKPIINIFKNKGENYFRKLENNLLKKILKKYKNNKYILSVGGGTPCFYNNIYLLNKHSKTFYLRTDNYTLLKRLLLERKKRPLIELLEKKELFKFIMKNLLNRSSFYEKARYKINVTNKSKCEIIYNIIKYIK
ncbi:shikimate kinase [Blattabacterium cuenoti]|uniref:shikimate kinase n=1 Tax=Blattabacterium cuenoti TaxID=1653831 RepID=UPI00163B9A5C|nr:shikimate kinase [Blattabacterium cuenoti]